MTPSDMETAMRVQLSTLTSYPIAWEDDSYDPSQLIPYLQVQNIPIDTRAAGISSNAPNRQDSIFQVMVCTPSGSGTGTANEMADAVEAKFKRGTSFPAADGYVRMDMPPKRGKPMHADAWSYMPISIRYFGYMNP